VKHRQKSGKGIYITRTYTHKDTLTYTLIYEYIC